MALSLAVAVFTASNTLQPDSGLLAVTVMGIALANQRAVSIVHIIEFKENLRVLLISMLFIVLAANMDGQTVRALLPQGLVFVAVLVLLVRPLAVFISTIGARAAFREKVVMSWLAPRGIVAASIASMFAFRLESLGYADAALIEPITFIVVAGTVLIYGLTAAPLARWSWSGGTEATGRAHPGRGPLGQGDCRGVADARNSGASGGFELGASFGRPDGRAAGCLLECGVPVYA